jgi:predicted nucleic acid-binding protein
MKIIISDTGPLIALAKTNNLYILQQLFSKIIIPDSVLKELQLGSTKAGTNALHKAIFIDKWIEVSQEEVRPPSRISNVLDPGEAEAIVLANKLNLILLIDERRGRTVAKQELIEVIGTAGLLLLAKRKKIIPEVKKVLIDIQNCGYRFADKLLMTILQLAEEDE